MKVVESVFDEQLLSPAYVQSPYATYDALRSTYPVYWCEKWNAWLITRYDDAVAILRDHEGFSNRGRYTEYLSVLTQEQQDQLTYLRHHYEHGGLVQSDPPNHTRLRKLIGGAFTPRIVEQMRDLVKQITGELIDAFEHESTVELVHAFAFALPAMVIAGVLGVPAEERDMFKKWSSDIQRFLGSGQVRFDYALDAQDAWKNMNGYFTELLAQRRKTPRNDLVSALAAAHEDGERLTDDELIRTCGALLIAGHETTTNLICNGVWLLLTHPDQARMLRDDPTLYGSAVEEFLRFESPFQAIPRTVTKDVTIRDQPLAAGDLVYVMLGAANRDPQRFDDPHRLDIRRTNNRHVAFGYGVHFCLGSALARMEAPIAISALFDRLPSIALDPDAPPVWKVSMGQRGMERFLLKLR